MSGALEMVGPLAEYWHGFREHLEELGYLPDPVRCQKRLMAHLSEYLQREGLTLGDLDDAAARRFMAERRAVGRTDRLSDKALVPLLAYLRSLGVLPEVQAVPPGDGGDQVIARYRTYLRHERGLVPYTVDCYARYARLLLASLAGRRGGPIGEIDAEAVIAFVAAEAARRRVAAAKQLVNATRWFLRYLHLSGLVRTDYSVVVPGVAGWQQTAIPKSVPPASVVAALAEIDRASVTGRRDYALVYLIARLGLRASEAAALTVEDIDWQRGTIYVRGKGHRDELMPLPADVGEVLADYLADARQRRHDRFVFQRVHAPIGRISVGAVHGIVEHAFSRAGIAGVGPHRLRHGAATEMLRQGGSLAEIGQVLRHRSAASTAIYAKVDYADLAVFARAWPGGGR